jgi:hypothetical protein
MDMHYPSTEPQRIPDDPGFAPRFDAIRSACAGGSPRFACKELRALHLDVDRFVESLKRGLFAAPLAWNDEQKGAIRWISLQHHRMARGARRVADGLAQDPDTTVDELSHATALGLHHMAEAMKCEMADAPREPRHYALLHSLMRLAISRAWQRDGLRLQVQGRDLRCTAESLYFRALLLARSSGPLTIQQVEILDAWFCMWMPALRGVSEPPEGPSLCADLNSNHGLRRGRAAAGVPVLYLAMLPAERGYQAIVRHFQAGEIVPAEGHASRFRLEEHMVVLDMTRRVLRRIRNEPAPRAPRLPSGVTTELHVGIGEIGSRPFAAAAPTSMAASLVPIAPGDTLPPRRERDNPIDAVYEVARRNVLVVDVSASGLGLEGALADCKDIAVGDVVALRLTEAGPLELGRVMRRAAADAGRVAIGVHRAPAPDEGRVLIGVRQLSASVQRLAVTHVSGRSGTRNEHMLFVPGQDRTGRQDAFLIAESALADRAAFDAEIGDQTFSLRINRVRHRGRGWVLAGFEIFAMHKRAPLAAAA